MRLLPDDAYQQILEALERIGDPRNTHFAGDAQVVARLTLALLRSLEPCEPVATIHEDGYWTRAENSTGKAVSADMHDGKLMRLVVYAAKGTT